MASSVVLRRHISDITQCPICLEVFDTPTSLPCLHTFCLRCLQNTFVIDYPGDVVACPVCRRDFQLPADGLAALPRNFILDSLVELDTTSKSAPGSVIVRQSAKTVSNNRPTPCEVVTDAEHIGEMTSDVKLKTGEAAVPASAATASLGNTNTAGDDDCSSTTLLHQDAQQSSTTSAERGRTSTTHCDVHTGDVDEAAEFCFDCRVDACCGDVHRHHRRRPMTEVKAECQRRLTTDLAHVTDALNATHVALRDVDHRTADILNQLQRKEGLAREQGDDQVEKRLNALSAEKDDAVRRLAARKERLDVDKMFLESFLKNGARRLSTTTTTAGLLRLVKEVKVEVRSLLSAHQTRLDKSNVDEMLQTSLAELVTTMEEEEKPVCAVTSLANELYVARSGSQDIKVFDVDSLSLRRRLVIAGGPRTWLAVLSFGHAARCSVTDMTSCTRHHCLYVADGRGGLVRRLDRTNGREVAKWSVCGKSPTGVSVTGTFHVVVSCVDSPSLRVYTALGCLVYELSVQRPELVGLVHAVQLDSGAFVVIGVTHTAQRLACICHNDTDVPDLIDSSGFPTHVALLGGRAGSYVWLAQRTASAGVRLVQAPASQCSAQLPKVELEEPDKICWDDSRKRLYAVDHGRLKVFRVHMTCDIIDMC